MAAEKKQYSIGIDIGGTNLKAVLFDGQKTIADYCLGTPQDSLEHLLVMLQALVEPLVKKAEKDKIKIKGVGVGVAGLVDADDCRIVDASNLPFLNGVKLRDEISGRLGLPAKIDNDAECFLRAEVKLGAAVKYDNVYGITLGTGIGGAWWFEKKMYYGPHRFSEPSRLIIDFANNTTLEGAYKKLSQSNPLNLAANAYRGDELARRSYEEIGKLLGTACANIVNLLDPEAIVFGGGVIASADLFLPVVKKIIDESLPKTSSFKKTKVLKSKFGNEAGAIGAALLIN